MYIIILLLTFIPILYRFSFWLYTIQLKEYRLDRFKEYLYTPQWKKAIINIGSIIEIILLFLSFLILINNNIIELFSFIIFFILLFYNVFVSLKILKKQIHSPKITSRMKVLIVFSFLIFSSLSVFIISFNLYLLYIFIFSILIINPIFIFINIFLLSPIVNYSKNNLIKSAIKKSIEIDNPIKIAITWSYWKSSVKEFLSHFLEQKNKTLKTPENINTELWVSNIILTKLSNKYKYFVAEMWAYKIWEIETLWEIVNHKYGFLTAIWNQHLWLFWSIENIKKAKFEIVKKIIKNDWILYINANNSNIMDYLGKQINTDLKWLKYIKYWIIKSKTIDDSIANSKIKKIEDWSTYFSMTYKWENYDFETNLIWKHNIINITWVLAFCIDMWIKKKDLQKYVKNIPLPKNTLEVIKTHKYTLINDTYNLSEDWLFAWIWILSSFKDNNKILVLDDILELGINSFKIHEDIWRKIASKNKINKIMLIWINYSIYVKNWLLEGGFKEENIISDLNNIEDNSILLFEWRNTKKYFDKIAK